MLWVWIDKEIVVGKWEGDQVGGGVQQSLRKSKREAERRHKSKIWVQDVQVV